MTRGPNRRSGGAGVRTGGNVDWGTDARQYTNAANAQQGRFVAWVCKIRGLGEIRICAPTGATQDEITRDLAGRYPTRTIEHVEPIR